MTNRHNSQLSEQDMLIRYQRAERLEQGVFTQRVAFNTTLFPHWIEDSDCFWYLRETKTGLANFGKEFRRVNATQKTNECAFDHQALAASLADAAAQAVEADNLPFDQVELSSPAGTVCFSAFNKRWQYSEATAHCEAIGMPHEPLSVSPDGKRAVFVRDHNLWLRDLQTEEDSPLTTDGEAFYIYAGAPTVYGRQESPCLDVTWSPDSQRLLTQVIDTRQVKMGPPLVQHVPSDGGVRPVVLNPERRMALPGDEIVETYRFLTIEVNSASVQWIDNPPCPITYPPYAGFFSGLRGWWDGDNRHAYVIDQARGGKRLRLLRCDSHTGLTQVLIEETADTVVTLTPVSHLCPMVIPLPDSNELIWYSERSGSAHLYLYELSSGKLKRPLTGPAAESLKPFKKRDREAGLKASAWLVRNILHVDLARRELFIQTAGRKPGGNPYYCDICRVNMDTGEFIEVVSEEREYVVCDQRSRIAWRDQQAKGVSPSGDFVVATRSRVDELPVSVLLDRDGNELLTLETADITGLPENWQWPEPVMLKAADGTTDIYGVVFRPSDFDPQVSYPVIDCTYAYSAPVGSFTNNNTGNWHYLSAAAYAELGFIVVMINNRGNDGLRDRAFNAYQDPVLPLDHHHMVKYNKADCVTGIQQLSKRYPYIDCQRVGVAEFGSIPTALAGLLVHPEFYRVGVCNNPMADSRLMASLGSTGSDAPQLEDFAKHLKGKLLLIAGMLDDVMPVSMTFRLVEALQKANKRFDMLLLPNLGHGSSGYATCRSWDYFVQHLLGETPPEGFKLTTGVDLLMEALTE